jgi:hypothetical protein
LGKLWELLYVLKNCNIIAEYEQIAIKFLISFFDKKIPHFLILGGIYNRHRHHQGSYSSRWNGLDGGKGEGPVREESWRNIYIFGVNGLSINYGNKDELMEHLWWLSAIEAIMKPILNRQTVKPKVSLEVLLLNDIWHINGEHDIHM